MFKIYVKKSAFGNGSEKKSDKNNFEKLKAEVIAILEKKDSEELKKAIEVFSKSEAHYTYLAKSDNGEWIEKAGYGVGTIRIWKGKKYKKISASPTRWVRVFDKEDRGAKSSMTRLINRVKNCKDENELYQFCMSNHALFQDENGVDLPIMDKLRAAIDIKKEKITGESENYGTYEGNGVTREKQNEFKTHDKITKEEADLHKVGRKLSQIPTSELKKEKDKYQRLVDNKTRNKVDHHNNFIFHDSYKQHLDAINSELEKRSAAKNTEKKEPEKTPDSKVLSNGKTVKEVREKYGIKVDENKAYKGKLATQKQIDEATKIAEKTELNREEMLKKPITRIQQYANSNVDDFDGGIDKFIEYKAEIQPEGVSMNEVGKEFARLINHNVARQIWSDYENGVLKINDDGYFVPNEESESEKHQNRSDAMKGNKNAYKGGYSDDEISKMKEIRDKVSDYFKKKKMDVKPNSSAFEDKLIDMAHRSKDKEVEDMCRALRSFDGKTPDEFQKQYEERIIQSLHDNKDFSFEENIAGEVGQNSDYWAAHIDERPSQGLIEMATLLKLAQNHVTEKDITDKQVRRGFSGAVQVLTDMKKIARNPNAFDEVINGYKELAAKFNPDAGKEEKKEIKEEVKSKEPENPVKESEKEEVGNNLLKAVNKYANDKIIKNVVKNVSDSDFTSTDPTRAFMNGSYCEDGYKIATNGRILCMIKDDYDKADEGKLVMNKGYMKDIDSIISGKKSELAEKEADLKELGHGTMKYINTQSEVEDLKKEIANAEKTKETGKMAKGDFNFPAYKRVIPSISRDTVPMKGFEDYNKIMKVAKTAIAYGKETDHKVVPVKVGNLFFDPEYLLNSLAMAEKHGLNNVIAVKDSELPAIEFNGDNGSVVIMPMQVDSPRNVFNADTGTLDQPEDMYDDEKQKNEEFLSIGEKETKETRAKNIKSAKSKMTSGLLTDVFNKIQELAGLDTKVKLKLNSGNSIYTDKGGRVNVFEHTWTPDEEKRSREKFIEKYGTENGNKITDAIEQVQKLNGYMNDHIYDYDEKYNEHSSEINNYIEKKGSEIRSILGMKEKNVKKSIFSDLLSDFDCELIDEDEEDSDYSDYDASQPDLFNSTQYKVSEALDDIFCRC